MKFIAAILTVFLITASCDVKVDTSDTASADRMIGTWKLLTATLTENGKSTVTDYGDKISFIKIINKTHFAFLQHDLKKGKDSAAVFVAGGGTYTLKDSTYTEKLEYCSAREWEGNDFVFSVTINGDTLVQHGVEKLEAVGVDRINTEKYVRVK